jgi:methyl-accepting chemotaxis protein
MLLRNAVILLLGMLCSMWILNGLVRSLARPIHQMEGVLAALSSGEADLTRRVRVATIDEIGQMAQGFNGFMVKLQAMIRRIMVTAKAMEGAAHGLAETSTTLEQTATSVHLQAETMDQQSIALAGSMDQMNRTAHRAADELSHVAAATEEMTSNLTEVGKQIQHARAVAARAREIALGNEQSSDQLQTRAAEIGSIIDVISTIANQIKLLSFNAAIEAARAGQAGRGFTVVANEVKALSSETAEATMQIVTQIEKIREDSKQSAAGSLAISSVINEMDEIMTILVNAMGEQEAATGQITHSIHDLSEGISVISGNLAGATTHTKEIAKQVSQLADHAEKTKRSAGGTIAATDHLHQLVGSLRALVGQMKINE